jgi:SAM-dependent methyltransferase
MNGVAAHYDQLLAAHYTWMLGDDLESAAARELEYFEGFGIGPGRVAVDLGCGPGLHVLALADLGFSSVVGVDLNLQLLDELARHAGSRPAVRPVHADLMDALPDVAAGGAIDLVVCMQDTILHLPDRDSVIELFRRVASSLAPRGQVLLSYRDLTSPLAGLDRFIPVRDDADRIMLCCVEPSSDEHATLTDLIYTRGKAGWQLHKSSYQKLRLAPDWLAERLVDAGLTITSNAIGPRGMWSTLAANLW